MVKEFVHRTVLSFNSKQFKYLHLKGLRFVIQKEMLVYILFAITIYCS